MLRVSNEKTVICLNLPETLFRVASSLLIDMLFYSHLEINKSTHKISVMKLLFCNFVENFNRLAQKISHSFRCSCNATTCV